MKTITLEAIARGEAKTYTFEVRDAAGALMDLSTKKVVATLRASDVIVVEKKNTAAGGDDAQLEGTALGIAKLKLAPTDTANRDPGKLDGDLWVYTDATDPVRVARFQLSIEQAQTRAFPVTA